MDLFPSGIAFNERILCTVNKKINEKMYIYVTRTV